MLGTSATQVAECHSGSHDLLQNGTLDRSKLTSVALIPAVHLNPNMPPSSPGSEQYSHGSNKFGGAPRRNDSIGGNNHVHRDVITADPLKDLLPTALAQETTSSRPQGAA